MKYKTIVTLKRLRLYNFITRYFYRRYLLYRDHREYKKDIKLQEVELQSKGKYCEVPIKDYKIILDRSDLHDFRMLLQLQKGEVYEPEVTEFIRKELKPGNTFMDLGANIGYYTILASQLVGPTGKVLSFEPNQKTFSRLLRNIRIQNIKNVDCFNFALSDYDGVSNLYLDKEADNGGGSIQNKRMKNVYSTVIVKKTDGVLKNIGKVIDIIKMDVEGSEISILKNMDSYIRENKGLKIIMEWYSYYRSFDDYSYLDKNFNILLLLWESNAVQKYEIRKYYEIPGLSNLLLVPK